MNPQPVPIEEATAVRKTLLSYLAVGAVAVVLVLLVFSWLESRQVATITFLSNPQTQIAVDIRGAVSTPGVVYLGSGSRLIDVVNTSGGLTQNADHSLVNLSTRVLDGQLIVIPTQAPEGDSGSLTGLININTASIDELKQLPGIGDVLAERIVAYREFSGPFQSTAELENVEGISPSLVESLSPYITVSNDD